MHSKNIVQKYFIEIAISKRYYQASSKTFRLVMRNLFLICFFLVGTISANDDVWKPKSDYFVDCSHTWDDWIYSRIAIVKLYAHYDLDKDMKFITVFTTSKEDDYFRYESMTAIREYSTDKTHEFLLRDLNYWDPKSGGEMKEWEYFGRVEARLYRENLRISMPEVKKHTCSIMTAEEYRTTINDLKKQRDVLVQDFIEKRKGQLKL